MTEAILKAALRKVLSTKDNLDALYNASGMDNTKSDDELLDAAVDAVYSEELLAEIERRLGYVKAASAVIDGYDTGALALEYERNRGRDALVMPCVYPERLALIGSVHDHSGFNGSFSFYQEISTYVSESGEIVLLNEYTNSLLFEDEPDTEYSVVYREPVSGEGCYTLNEIEFFFPAEYQGLWEGL